MLEPLISVIVPVYNVAFYLRKCLDSLKNQTMKEIEIICIDDGSTDGSGESAEEYKSDEWPLFRIIHTENRGLSAARNRGIDEAKADWIMFVDSDDWVDREFCRVPYEVAIENKADMVIFEFDEINNGKVLDKGKEGKSFVGGIDEFTAHEFGCVAVWNKLYKKILFRNISFPEGRIYEDIATTHRLVHASKKIYKLRDALYHHVSREGSITHTITKINKKDIFISRLERRDFLFRCGYYSNKLDHELIAAAIGYLYVTSPYENEYSLAAKEIVDSCKTIPRGLSWKKKIALIVWKINSSLFYKVSKATVKKRKYQRTE